jgi:hypothetical protein
VARAIFVNLSRTYPQISMTLSEAGHRSWTPFNIESAHTLARTECVDGRSASQRTLRGAPTSMRREVLDMMKWSSSTRPSPSNMLDRWWVTDIYDGYLDNQRRGSGGLEAGAERRGALRLSSTEAMKGNARRNSLNEPRQDGRHE